MKPGSKCLASKRLEPAGKRLHSEILIISSTLSTLIHPIFNIQCNLVSQPSFHFLFLLPSLPPSSLSISFQDFFQVFLVKKCFFSLNLRHFTTQWAFLLNVTALTCQEQGRPTHPLLSVNPHPYGINLALSRIPVLPPSTST